MSDRPPVDEAEFLTPLGFLLRFGFDTTHHN